MRLTTRPPMMTEMTEAPVQEPETAPAPTTPVPAIPIRTPEQAPDTIPTYEPGREGETCFGRRLNVTV